MAQDDAQTRRERLQALRNKRKKQPSFQGKRRGLKGLWSEGDTAGDGDEDGGGKRIAKLLANRRQGGAGGTETGGGRFAGRAGGRFGGGGGRFGGGGGGGGGDIEKLLERFPRLRERLAGRGTGGDAQPESAAPLRRPKVAKRDPGSEDILSQGNKLTSSSTPEEVERYRRQLEARADWLEAALQETLMELEMVNKVESPAATDRDSDAPAPGDAASQMDEPTPRRPARKTAVRKKVATGKGGAERLAALKKVAARKKSPVKKKTALDKKV